MTKGHDFNRAAADQMLDIQEAHRDHLQAEPTAPPNPGHPALDRPEHYYLVRLYDHPGVGSTRRYPWFIAMRDDYANERIGGGETLAGAVATCCAGLIDCMTVTMDRPTEAATRTLAASLIVDGTRQSGDQDDSIERIIAEIPDPECARSRLLADLWRLINHVGNHEPDPGIGEETRKKVMLVLDGMLSATSLQVRDVVIHPPHDKPV